MKQITINNAYNISHSETFLNLAKNCQNVEFDSEYQEYSFEEKLIIKFYPKNGYMFEPFKFAGEIGKEFLVNSVSLIDNAGFQVVFVVYF